VSTYQSISGAGQKGIDKLKSEMKDPEINSGGHRIFLNANFHETNDPAGFTVEELKIRNETRKILNHPLLRIAVTCVRLPIMGGHGESVNIETETPFELQEFKELLAGSPSISIMDDPINDIYPTPLNAADKDDVFIGRIRTDHSAKNAAHLWIVADNLRKGAAANAVQIAELLLKRDLLDFEAPEEF
jgi:aspartate-semialdehyde dehydrogenase